MLKGMLRADAGVHRGAAGGGGGGGRLCAARGERRCCRAGAVQGTPRGAPRSCIGSCIGSGIGSCVSAWQHALGMQGLPGSGSAATLLRPARLGCQGCAPLLRVRFVSMG